MGDISNFESGDKLRLSFSEKQEIQGEVEGVVVSVLEDSLVCEPVDMMMVLRFKIQPSENNVEFLLNGEKKRAVISHRYDNLNKVTKEEQDLIDALEEIDGTEIPGIIENNNYQDEENFWDGTITSASELEQEFDNNIWSNSIEKQLEEEKIIDCQNLAELEEKEIFESETY